MDHPFFTSTEPLIKVIKSLPPIQQDACRHIFHVDRRSHQIAKAMAFDPFWLRVLRFAARMHDLSKFLPKYRPLFFDHPGKFSPQQAQRARKHAQVSAVIVQKLWNEGNMPVDFAIVAPAIFMIAGHHWSFRESQSRYQAMLREGQFAHCAVTMPEPTKEIPLLGSRILKVADYFEARTEKRHYLDYAAGEKPLTKYEAYGEVASGAYEEFDPEVVRVLEQLLDQEPTEVCN